MSKKKSLSILSYNIQQLPFSNCLSYIITGFHNKKIKLTTKILAQKLISTNPDIIVLQECFMVSLYEEIKRKLKPHGYLYCTNILKENDWSRILNGGIVIISKYPINQSNHYRFKSAIFPEILASKGFLHSAIQIEESEFNLIGLHLNSSTKDNYEYDRPTRNQQLHEIKNYINQKQLENIILAGDFNINRFYLPEYQHLIKYLNLHQPEFIGNFTLDEINNSQVDKYEGQQWIDYIFTLKDQKGPMAYSNQVMIYQDQNGNDLSDHYAVLGVIFY